MKDYVDELLPCPFCGGKNLLWEGALRYGRPVSHVVCWNCFAEGPVADHLKNGRGNYPKAKKLWNKRAAARGG